MTSAVMVQDPVFPKSEPRGWLDEFYHRASNLLKSAPAPKTTSETWRRTPFGAWNLDHLPPALPDGARCSPPASETAEDLAGLFFQQDFSRKPFSMLCAEWAARGATLADLETAVETHAGLTRNHLEEFWAGEDFKKLELANRACWRGGGFLHVPPGIKSVAPVRFLSRQEEADFHFPRNLVVVGAGSEVVILEEHQSGSTSPHVSAAFSRLILEEGAKVHFFYVQELSPSATHFWHQKCTLGKDAQLFHTSVILGGGIHKTNLDVDLKGRGARSELFGILLGKGDQHLDIRTYQHHAGDHTYSDLLFRSALKDRARSIYNGYIRVEKEAAETNAYQANHNLLLSSSARADSTPVLEILTDSVHCKHGATAGPLSSEELFYLQTRGLAQEEAEKMLVRGFFDPILKRLPLTALWERLAGRIEDSL